MPRNLNEQVPSSQGSNCPLAACRCLVFFWPFGILGYVHPSISRTEVRRLCNGTLITVMAATIMSFSQCVELMGRILQNPMLTDEQKIELIHVITDAAEDGLICDASND